MPGLNRIPLKAVVIFLALALPIALRAQSPAATPFNDEGTFVISYAGKPIGTEEFSIHSSSNQVEAEGQISLHYTESGKKVDVQTTPKLILSPTLEPVFYTWDEKSPDANHLEVDFTSSPARSSLKKSDGKQDVREFQFPPSLVVLDDNVVHHYELLALRYLAAGGGVQSFNGFIPQEALPGGLAVADATPDSGNGEEKKKDLRHLVVTTDNLRVDMWVERSGRVERVSFPSAQLEAVRKK